MREAEPEHRHLSHLYSLYPGREITPYSTPQLAAATEKSLEKPATAVRAGVLPGRCAFMRDWDAEKRPSLLLSVS